MARASGRLVMIGDKDGEYRMTVEFSDTSMPHPLRIGGYFLGKRTSAEMIEELSKITSTRMEEKKPDVTGSLGNVTTVESQSSTEFPKPATPGSFSPSTAMDSAKEDFAKEVSAKERFDKERSAKERSAEEVFAKERSHSVVGLQPLLGPFAEKPARAMGRAPIGSLRRDHSADEVETEVDEVDDYYVVGEDGKAPLSLCLLPLELEEERTIGGSVSTTKLFVRGKSNGVAIMRPISAWKLIFPGNLSFQILGKITVKSNAKWVKLEKPRSQFKESADDAFVVAKVLALLKKEPQASEDRVWNHLLEGDVAPENCREHLSMQYPLMEQFINLDPVLREADAQKTLLSLFNKEKEANSGKRVLSDRDNSDEVHNRPLKKFKPGNVVQGMGSKAMRVGVTMPEDVNMGESDSEEEYYGEDDVDDIDEEYGDSFCIFCDDGGNLLCCDGPCLRSFHATKEDGRESKCRSLGLSETAVARMVGKWLCRNCKYNKHQCYVCGELGASTLDEALGIRQEVFVCNVACCGKFYHPKCIASKITVAPSERETLAENIQAGKESVTCPLHTCKVCGRGEDREEEDLILVKCRRCPSAWHKKCLPRTISFAEDAEKRHLEVRAWKFGESHKQFICYCTNHRIIEALGTPKRNHVNLGLSPEEARELEEAKEVKEFEKRNIKKVGVETKEPARDGAKPSFAAASMGKSVVGKKHPSVDLIAKGRPDRLLGPSSSVPSPRPTVSKDAAARAQEAAERTIESIVAASKRKVTHDSVKSKQENNLPGIYKPRRNGSKEFMKMGMIHSILEAARAAMDKIRRNRESDAMTICDRKTVQQVMHEEDRLKTYLAPTMYGKRYTSYGRHFTKLQKLQKVVEILQPYIWDRDTIVDFSCGDNSFCRLLREALSKARKTNCQFKNFDIFPSRDSFGFEQKDWLDVGMKDCGPGENLVIGLNPPFAFVEKFVSHALGMNPRLLVLIVPPMKKNLEHLGYECLVDDDSLMVEKSFYLPGSVNEKSVECLEQGNNMAPHFFIYCSRKFYGRYQGGGVPEEGPLSTSTNPSSTIVRKSVQPAKPPPPPEPTAHLFIPTALSQQRPQLVPLQQPGHQPPQNLRPLHNRIPRQVPPSTVLPPDLDSLEEGELFTSLQGGHVPFKNKWRAVWRRDDQQQQLLLPPPLPPLPPMLPHVQHLHLRAHHPPPPHFEPHHPGAFQFRGPHHHQFAGLHHHRPVEYNPFEPELFPPGSHHPGLPPPRFCPPYNDGFSRPQNEPFFHGPSPSRNHDFSPPGTIHEDENGSYGGWIDR